MLRTITISALVSLVAAAAGATVFVQTDLGELSRATRSIVRGRISAVESRWAEDHRRIETLVTLDVETALKGPLAEHVQFTVPGGQLGRYTSIVVGAPQFGVSQHVLVFLGGRGAQLPHVLGWMQGVFRIVESGGLMVMPPPMVSTGSVSAPIARGSSAVPLAEFERRVRAFTDGRL